MPARGRDVDLCTENMLSLFSGIGGLDIGVASALRGLSRAPRTVCMVEGEVFSAALFGGEDGVGRLGCGAYLD